MSLSRVIRRPLQDLEEDITVPVVTRERLNTGTCNSQQDVMCAAVSTHGEKAATALDWAREESERILADAKAEANRLRQQVYDEAFESGVQNARQETEEACKAELEHVRSQVRNLLHDAQTERNLTLTSLQDVMTELVMEAVETVLHTPGVVDRVDVTSWVAALIELEVHGANIQVRMHPDDIDVAGTLSPSDERLSSRSVVFRPDVTQTRGGCVVVTDTEEIDATVETRLEVLKPNVRRAIGGVLDERDLRVQAGVQTDPVLSRLRSRE